MDAELKVCHIHATVTVAVHVPAACHCAAMRMDGSVRPTFPPSSSHK